MRQIGRSGTDPGELRKLFLMIAIDSEDKIYIYVAENSNHCVSVFTSHGGYLTSFGSQGSGPGQFQSPRGIAVENLEIVHVCDGSNKYCEDS